MLAEFVVHLGGQILYRSLDPTNSVIFNNSYKNNFMEKNSFENKLFYDFFFFEKLQKYFMKFF